MDNISKKDVLLSSYPISSNESLSNLNNGLNGHNLRNSDISTSYTIKSDNNALTSAFVLGNPPIANNINNMNNLSMNNMNMNNMNMNMNMNMNNLNNLTTTSYDTLKDKRGDDEEKKRQKWDPWTEIEIELFFIGFDRFGKDFRKIAQIIGSKKTWNQVRYYYYRVLKKINTILLPDYNLSNIKDPYLLKSVIMKFHELSRDLTPKEGRGLAHSPNFCKKFREEVSKLFLVNRNHNAIDSEKKPMLQDHNQNDMNSRNVSSYGNPQLLNHQESPNLLSGLMINVLLFPLNNDLDEMEIPNIRKQPYLQSVKMNSSTPLYSLVEYIKTSIYTNMSTDSVIIQLFTMPNTPPLDLQKSLDVFIKSIPAPNDGNLTCSFFYSMSYTLPKLVSYPPCSGGNDTPLIRVSPLETSKREEKSLEIKKLNPLPSMNSINFVTSTYQQNTHDTNSLNNNPHLSPITKLSPMLYNPPLNPSSHSSPSPVNHKR